MSPLLPLLVVLFAPPPPAVEAGPGGEAEVLEVHGRRLRRDARDGAAATAVVVVGDDPRPVTGLGAVVERAAGVRVVRAGDAGGSETVQLRGAGGHQVAVWLDGVPLDGERGEAVDLAMLPPGVLDRVEVVRGASGAAYGSGAQGGVVHLRSRRFEGAGGAVAARGGSFGLGQLDGGAGGGGAWGDVMGAVSLSRAAGDFAFTDAVGRAGVRRNNDHRRGSLLLRGRWRPRAGLEVGALALGALGERGEPGRDAFPDGDARLERRSLVASGWAEGDGFAGALSWSARGWHRRRRQVFSDPVALYADPRRSTLDDAASGVTAGAAWEAGAWHRPSVRVEARYAAAESGVVGPDPVARAEARAGGAAVAGWEVEPVGWLMVAGLLRLDLRSGRGAVVAPKLGVVARPVEGLTLRLNGGRLFRDPGFDELYFVGQGVRGNPELRPEDGWGGDVGVEGRLGPVSVEVVGFAQRYERLIVFVPLDAYRVGARDDFAAAVDGVEAAARVEGARLGVEVAYLGQRARFTSGGAAPLPYRPAHRVTGLAQVTVGPVTPFVGGRWQGEVTVDRFGARRQAGYGLVDFGLRVALPWGLGAAVEVANALDRRGAFDVAQRPLPGRSLVVELSGRWD